MPNQYLASSLWSYGKTRIDKKRSMQHKAKNGTISPLLTMKADAIGIGKYVADLYNIQVHKLGMTVE